MNLILSIFLSIALALSGTGTLPAEPETATTWTIRNIAFESEGESHAIQPELRFTTAVAAEKAAAHFEIGSDGRTLLPVSAQITPDELRFSLGNGGRAYSLTAEEFEKMTRLDEDNAQIMTIIGDFFTSYGALIGMVTGDEAQAEAYSVTVFNALLNACDSSLEPVEIEFDGKNVEAQRAELTLNFEAAFRLMDELRSCDIEPMRQLMDSVLAMCNLQSGAEYESFAELAAEIDEGIEYVMPLTITIAETEDSNYALLECDTDVEAANGPVSMRVREEIVITGDESTVEATATMTLPNNTSADYVISAQMTGPLTAPESMHMSYDIAMDSEVQVYYEAEAEDADAENVEIATADGEDDIAPPMVSETLIQRNEIHMTLDTVAEDGLDGVQFAVNFQEIFDGEEQSSGVFLVNSAERRESDESVTADVRVTLLSEDVEFGLSFELNRAETAPVDYFDGTDLYEFTSEALDGDDNGPSKLQAALTADASQLYLDVMQLASDESIQALANLGGQNLPDFD